MFTAQVVGNVTILTEWKLCCVCCRMINRNLESHVIGHKDGIVLLQHMVCPPTSTKDFERRLLK